MIFFTSSSSRPRLNSAAIRLRAILDQAKNLYPDVYTKYSYINSTVFVNSYEIMISELECFTSALFAAIATNCCYCCYSYCCYYCSYCFFCSCCLIAIPSISHRGHSSHRVNSSRRIHSNHSNHRSPQLQILNI